MSDRSDYGMFFYNGTLSAVVESHVDYSSLKYSQSSVYNMRPRVWSRDLKLFNVGLNHAVITGRLLFNYLEIRSLRL